MIVLGRMRAAVIIPPDVSPRLARSGAVGLRLASLRFHKRLD